MSKVSLIEQYVIDKVKEKRIASKMTQAVLSVSMDLSPKFVGNVESLKSNDKYNLNHLNKLAVIFECSIKDFFPEKPFEQIK
ncbi:MAG: XRE family transcriptional regulator [Pedobacter sp.]|nr:XRE family transcriptional regulator [Pedobacter sp.]